MSEEKSYAEYIRVLKDFSAKGHTLTVFVPGPRKFTGLRVSSDSPHDNTFITFTKISDGKTTRRIVIQLDKIDAIEVCDETSSKSSDDTQ
jgi:hypothetical protein